VLRYLRAVTLARVRIANPKALADRGAPASG
jgi:hypothetical protein